MPATISDPRRIPSSPSVGRGRRTSAARAKGPPTRATATGPFTSMPSPAATYGASGDRRGGGRSSQARPARTPTATHAVSVMSRFP